MRKRKFQFLVGLAVLTAAGVMVSIPTIASAGQSRAR